MPEWQNKYRIAAVVYAATISSSIFFTIIVEMTKGHLKPVLSDNIALQQNLLYVFYGIVLMQFFTLQGLHLVFKKKIAAAALPQKAQFMLSSTIVTGAVCESMVVLGLVLFFVAGYYREFYIFLFLAMVLQIFYFPRPSRWQALLSSESTEEEQSRKNSF